MQEMLARQTRKADSRNDNAWIIPVDPDKSTANKRLPVRRAFNLNDIPVFRNRPTPCVYRHTLK